MESFDWPDAVAVLGILLAVTVRVTTGFRIFAAIPILIVLGAVSGGGSWESSYDNTRTTTVAAGGLLFFGPLLIPVPGRPARPEPLAAAGQVAAGHSPLHRAVLPVDRGAGGGDRGLVRHPVHRPLSQGHVRLSWRVSSAGTTG